MSELTLLLLRIGFLVLMWAFVFAVVYSLRADLFGGRPGRVTSVPPRASAGKKRGRKGPKTLIVTAGPLTGTKINLG